MTSRSPDSPRRAVTFESTSPEATRMLAQRLAGVAAAGDRLALIGPLGAGKTQFAKGFALGLSVTAVVNSPSFTLMAEYAGRLPLFHQDLYRLAGAAEAFEGGLLDERQDEGVTLTEWADRLDASIDADRLEIRLDVTGERTRRIMLLADPDGTYRTYLETADALGDVAS